MATIAVAPFVLEDCLLKIGTDNYEAHVSRAEFKSRTSVIFRGLTPLSRFGKTLWNLQLDFAQDWETVNALSRYLHDNEGTTAAVELYPVSGGTGFSATVLLMPGSIGGQVEQTGISSVTLECTGKPTVIEESV